MRTRALAAVLASGVLVLSASGCTSDDPGKNKTPSADGSSGSAGASDSASADPSSISPPLDKLPKVKGKKGGIKDLALGDCKYGAGQQSVSGTITSSAGKVADYLVTVSWTTATSDVMGRGFTVLQDVQPGQSVDFTIEAKVKKGAVKCVPGVVYGTIKG
ncbi:MAG: hypothetical protein R2731_08930 [Nocardioides sp.]